MMMAGAAPVGLLSLHDDTRYDPSEIDAFTNGTSFADASIANGFPLPDTPCSGVDDDKPVDTFVGILSPKAMRLWGGDISDYDNDHSRADLAMCVLLADATKGSRHRIDRMFRQSGLYRDLGRQRKWDECHSADGRTYGQMTIDKAVAWCEQGKGKVSKDQQKTGSDLGNAEGLGIRRGDNAPPKVTVKDVADELCQTDHFAQGPGGALYYYANGRFCPNGVEYVCRRVKNLLLTWAKASKWTSHFGREVAEYIRLTSDSVWEQPPLHIVNVVNGLYDLSKGVLVPHTPDHRSPVQLPFAYDQNARCPQWDQFIEQVFTRDCQTLAYEVLAYLMRPDLSQQVAILLFGTGANGKSRYLRGVTNFLGHDNVAALSLHRLESDRFATARLVGKLANICPDLPSQVLASTSNFKQLVGGDTVLAERKFETSFEFNPYTRFLFSANNYPRSEDASDAFFRRWLVIPFERSFHHEHGATPHHVLDARLKEPCELSGLFNQALKVLPDLEARGSFTHSESTRRAGSEFQQQTDPVAVWLEAETITSADAKIPKRDLYIKYSGQMSERNELALTQKAFSLAVKRLRPQVREGQPLINGQRTHAWIGLGIKTAAHRAQDAQGCSQIINLNSFNEER